MGTSINIQPSRITLFILFIMSLVTTNVMAASTLVTTTTTTNVYDEFGNPTSITVAVENDDVDGQGNPITLTYTTTTTNSYHNNDTDWHLGRLVCATVTQTNADSSYATRVSGFEYNANGLLTREVIEPKSGDIAEPTATPALPDCVTDVDSFDPTYNDITLITDYDYDAFGNKDKVTVSGDGIVARDTQTQYDARGQFAETVTNALGHQETRVWDARFGVMLSLTGPNGITTEWQYDSFGRKTKEIRAASTLDSTETTINRYWCDEYLDENDNSYCPSNGVLVLETVTDGAPLTVEYSDVLGRVVQTETEGFDGNSIYVDTVYDAQGRIDKKSRPYFDGELNCVSGTDKCWHSFDYDVLGRVTKETAPNGATTTNVYAGLQSTIENALQQLNVRMKNARGEMVYVRLNGNNTTHYEYDPFGNLLKVTGPGGTTTTNEYDIRGRKIEMIDPDMGYWTYEYNALGELVAQTDAKDNAAQTGPTVTMEYDKLGRLIKRTEAEGITEWTYDFDATNTYYSGFLNGADAHSIGKLVYVDGAEGKDETYLYDDLGRLIKTHTEVDSTTYTVEQSYDSEGRVSTVTYPTVTVNGTATNLKIQNNYNSVGYLASVSDFNDVTKTYWTADEQNAEGQLTKYTFGNGIVAQQTYKAETGLIDTIQTHTTLAATASYDIQDLTFTFDAIGNLKQRQDLNPTNQIDLINYATALTEDFKYDSINRLKETTLDNWTNTKYVKYDAAGNITEKDNIGNTGYTGFYSYSGASGPHAVDSVTVNGNVRNVTYDANGNMLTGWNFSSGIARSQTWTSYNKVKTIAQGATTLTFSYGADRARFKQVNGTKTTYYIGGLYEKEAITGGASTHIHYIQAGGTTMAVYKKEVDSTATAVLSEKTLYMHRDHLGSVTVITDHTAAILTTDGKLSYDAWGQRRNEANWSDAYTQPTLLETVRGFTNHEMLDDVGLIHMNGRVYDPDLGRFISADPHVQQPLNGQNLNRYSYVLNNPLSYTDPSGYFFSSIFKAIKSIVKSVVKAVKSVVKSVSQSAIGRFIVGAVVCGPNAGCHAALAAGFTAANGGSLSDIVKSAAITYATVSAFGELHDMSPGIEKIVAHGVVGGISSEVQGGDFLQGFLSAGAAQAFAPAIDKILPNDVSASGIVARTATAAVVGGVSSVLGGGKFQNGAVMGAFSRLYNHERDNLNNIFAENQQSVCKGQCHGYDGTPGRSMTPDEELTLQLTTSVASIFAPGAGGFTLLNSLRSFVSTLSLRPTHALTMGRNAFNRLVKDIRVNGIQEPIKFVVDNGVRFVVDGHHRLAAARQIGLKQVPAQQVSLPYKGYSTTDDLIYTQF